MRRLLPFAFMLACAQDDDGGDELGAPQTSSAAAETTTTAPADDGDEDGSSSDAPATDGSSSSEDGEDDHAADETSSGSASDGSTTASDDAADDGASAECMELMACCDQLGADIYTGCATVVDLAMPDLCSSTLDTYHGEGYCTGEPYCDELADCCPELPPGQGWQDTCTYYADLGNQPQCAMLIGDYQMSGYCM